MGLCRLCLTDNALYIDIFGPDGLKLNISHVLSEFFWFQIEADDAISTVVCQKCWYSTSTFQSFHQSIRQAQQSLFKHHATQFFGSGAGANAAGTDSKPIFVNSVAAIDTQDIGVTVQNLVGSVHDLTHATTHLSAGDTAEFAIYSAHDVTCQLNDAGLTADPNACKLELPDAHQADTKDLHKKSAKQRTQNIKTEATASDQQGDEDVVEFLDHVEHDADDTHFIDDGGDDEDFDEEEEDEIDDDDEDSEDTDDDDDDYDGAAGVDDEDLPIVRNKHAQRESSASSAVRQKKKLDSAKRRYSRKGNRADEDAQIRAVCNIFCSLCQMSFDTFCDLMKHYRLAHDRKGYVTCCDRRLATRCRLLEHIETHLNPEAFQCTVCEARFSGRFALKKHAETHVSPDEKPFACADCPTRYTKAVLLARHRYNVHSADADKTHVCVQCDKRYLSAAKLAEHVKRSHDFVPEICDFCGKEFKSIYNLNVHRTEVHMGHEVPRLQCNICGTWLREKYLKKHLKRHNAEVETCTVCGKKLQNKNSLGNHMRNVHGNRMHQCAVCGKTFSKPLSLREHMALHTGQDLYTCPYCPKTFKSGANMHSHRKKFHFEDWSKDRGKRLVTSKYL